MSFEPARYQDRTMGAEQVRISGSFSVNGTVIDSTSIRGKGFSGITRTGAGTYSVNLTSSYLSLLAGTSNCSQASYWTIVPGDTVTSATAPAVSLGLYVIGVGVSDPSVPTRIHFDFVLATSGLNK